MGCQGSGRQALEVAEQMGIEHCEGTVIVHNQTGQQITMKGTTELFGLSAEQVQPISAGETHTEPTIGDQNYHIFATIQGVTPHQSQTSQQSPAGAEVIIYDENIFVACGLQHHISIQLCHESALDEFRGSTYPYPTGSGTEQDPFKICTTQQFKNIAKNMGHNIHYQLAKDLDFSREKWTPLVGMNGFTSFKGRLDGKGFSLIGLRNDQTQGQLPSHLGIFESIEHATIKNINIIGMDFKGKDFVGSVAGKSTDSKLEQIFVSGLFDGERYVGSLVGEALNNTRVERVISQSHVTGLQSIGGIIGRAEQSSVYQASLNGTPQGATVAVAGSSYVGGIIGDAQNVEVSQVKSDQMIEGYFGVGGLIGHLSIGIVQDSYSAGEVIGAGNVGGLFGQVDQGTAQRVYFSGTVDFHNSAGSSLGGIAGEIGLYLYQHLELLDSFMAGTIPRSNGGIMGSIYGRIRALSNYGSSGLNSNTQYLFSNKLTNVYFNGSKTNSLHCTGNFLSYYKPSCQEVHDSQNFIPMTNDVSLLSDPISNWKFGGDTPIWKARPQANAGQGDFPGLVWID